MKVLNVPTAHADATKTRLQLLEMGYRPLPTAAKVAFMKGWPDMRVDAASIKAWPMMAPGNHPAITTAIQLEGNLVAIDVDVSDKRASNAILKLLSKNLALADAPLRDSGGAKFMLLARTDRPFGMWKTAKYRAANGGDHMVEVYGGASTRYFSCFGPHTLGDVVNGGYEVLKEYRWEDGPGSPLDTRPEDLPLITTDELLDLLLEVADLMRGVEGWTRVATTHEGQFEGGVEYDLTEDMTFTIKGGMQLTYRQAIDYALTERDARCSSSFIDGESSNTGKCRMHVLFSRNSDDALLAVFDHETWVQHYPASMAPRTVAERAEKAAALGAALRITIPDEIEEQLAAARESGADVDSFIGVVEQLNENMALNVKTGSVHYLNYGDEAYSHIPKTAARGLYAPHDLVWYGERGGKHRLSPVDAWAVLPDIHRIFGARFMPSIPDRFFHDEAGRKMYNTFQGLPAPRPTTPLARQCVMDFIEHLVPDPKERAWLYDWLATKWQVPASRNCAILFVAPGLQGAGRGTLFNLVDIAFGRRTSIVSETDLIGARFNSFMETNLITFCNEVGGVNWAERKRGYEVLKDRIDPVNKTITIERKGQEAYRTETFTSFMLATNNYDAMPFDAEDRRFAVITNGTRLEGELLQRVIEIGREELANALANILSEIVPTRDVSVAPEFEGRAEMLEASYTDLDSAIRSVIASAPAWRVWTRKDFEQAVRHEMGLSSKAIVPGLRKTVGGLTGRRGAEMGAYALPGKTCVEGVGIVRVIAKDCQLFKRASPKTRAELCAGIYTDDL